MTRIAIKAFNPYTGEVHDLDPKDINEYTAWVERGVNRGYKAYNIGPDTVRFISNEPGNILVFTAKVIENARCAMDYTDWTRLQRRP